MGKSKLTPQQRLEIEILYKNGQSIRSLADRYNVARATIRYIVDPKAAEKNRKNMLERYHNNKEGAKTK